MEIYRNTKNVRQTILYLTLNVSYLNGAEFCWSRKVKSDKMDRDSLIDKWIYRNQNQNIRHANFHLFKYFLGVWCGNGDNVTEKRRYDNETDIKRNNNRIVHLLEGRKNTKL